MKILVTGCNGYIGYPLVMELLDSGHEVVGVDNSFRVGVVNFISGDVQRKGNKHKNFTELNCDLADLSHVSELFAFHKFDVVIHLASQPSMPYSDMGAKQAHYTQKNNVLMNLNLLWAIKEHCPKARFIETTTTGVPGQHYKSIPEEPVINKAGSWYHVTKGFDSANMDLASRQWGLECLELRTAIVYGIHTPLLQEKGEISRFDTDFYFGTALNRFISQTMSGKDITIYGKGDQSKPFISLGDTVESLANSIDYKLTDKFTIMNQMTQMASINEIARYIEVNVPTVVVKHIDNPRKEKEDFRMSFQNKKFLKLLNKKPETILDGIYDMVKYFMDKEHPGYAYSTGFTL